MHSRKIMIAEDDTDISRLLKKILEKAGYETVQAFSGTEARLLVGMEAPDMLILDLMLPGLSGEEMIKIVRSEMGLDIPILILSAKAGLKDKVDALKAGADDYLTKPFEPEEVTARVFAVLRRFQGTCRNGEQQEEECYTYKKLRLFPGLYLAKVGEEELALTAHEFDILKLLLSAPEKVHSRESLYEQVWKGGYYGEDNTVNVHVSNLRRKLAAADPEEEYIRTVWGIGFKMA